MPARDPDPPSRAIPSGAPSAQPSADEFIRAVSHRPPPPDGTAQRPSTGLDTTVDDIDLPPAAAIPADLASPAPPAPSAADRTEPETPAVLDGPGEEVDELIGVTLSKTYEILRAVGEGGMGRVYEARHTRIAGKRFAVKTLHPEYLRQPDVLARFQREAEAAANIDDPHVVGVVDVDRTRDGRPFLVTDFLQGESLGARIERQRRLPPALAVRIVRQVCRALMAAHAAGIVHRDIKPDNVFLTGPAGSPTAKVLDFGISRLASAAGNSLTKTGMIMGTPAFMAPEQARGSKVDHRADLYAVGAVLYTALTGRQPFELDEPSAVLAAVLTRDPPRPRSFEPALDEELETIVQRAMAKEPDQRFADAAEIHAALAPFDEEQDADTIPSPGLGPEALRPRSHVRARPREGRARMHTGATRIARPALVLTAAAGLVWLLALCSQAVGAGLRLARDGRGMSGTETLIVLLIGAFTLLTPTVLAVRYVRQQIWDNTAKVLALGDALRQPLLVSIVAYGALALAIRFAEITLLDGGARVAWPMWTLLLALVGLAAPVGAVLTRRVAEAPVPADASDTARRLRALLPTMAAGAGGAVVLLTLVTAVALRRSGGRPAPRSAPAAKEDSATATSATASVPSARASTVELERAKRQGVAALEKLQADYPGDPVVLQALMLAQGKRPEGMAAAIDLAEKLFRIHPAAVRDEAVARFVFKATNGTDAVANKAFGLMSKQMASRGPDLLYELWIGGGSRAARAEQLLGEPAVRKLATPALQIAVDLRHADGCKAKGALLERAAKEGDERVIAILEPLSRGSRRGCGFLDLSPCPARCSAQAAQMKRTISAIRTRTK